MKSFSSFRKWTLMIVAVAMLLMSNTAFAGDGWNISQAAAGRTSLTLGGATVSGVFLPTASLGLSTNQNVPSYGVAGSYDFVVGQESTTGSNTSLTPWLGVGAALYVDFAPWINSNLGNPVIASGGFNIIGPEINGIVPSIQKTWDFNTGIETTTLNFTIFVNVFNAAGVIQVF